jgi:hypothetical protein
MSRNLSATVKQAIFAPQTNKVFLLIVEIDHADLGTPLRMVNNTENVVSNSDLYYARAFDFRPPVEEDGTIKNTRISIDNIDRALIDDLRTILSPATLSASVILSDDPDTIVAGPWDFVLRSISYTAEQISGELVPDNPLRLIASVVSYRNIEFPGLYG